jgi:predicted nucleic acid-binding protein
MPEVLFDCCCISNFALSNSLFILEKLYSHSAYITEFVSAEIMRGIQKGHKNLKKLQNSLKDGWLREISIISNEEKSLFEILSFSLGLGEASSIATAKTRGIYFASDYKTARRDAGLMGVKLTGTLGILYKAAEEKIVSVERGDIILGKMINKGFYSAVCSLKEIKK